MAITPEQREARKAYLGSSDMAAILGLDPWANASDIWLEKTGQLEPKPDNETGVQTIGNSFETAVLDLFSEQQGVVVKRNTIEEPLFFSHEIYCSNLDGLIDAADLEVVEAKTTGKIEEWGDPFTDDIPERNIIQTHEQMYVVSKVFGKECRIAWVPVLLPGYRNLEFRTYRVERNDDLMESIIAAGIDFWNNHVLPKIAPINYQPSMELLKRVRRIPEKVVAVPDDLVAEWVTANQKRLDSEKQEFAAKSALVAALGDAEGGEHSGGVITYYSQNRAGYTVEPTSFRVLRNPKGKK